ncbi:MAG: OmpA family protein [Pseudomonadota bacterium]
MKNSRTLAVLLFGSLLAMGSATADESYLVPSIVYTDDDKDRRVDDQFGGLEIALGTQLNDRFAFERRLGIHQLDGADDLDILELGIAGVVDLTDRKAITPYAMFGVSMLRTRSVLFDDELAPALSAGAGLKFGLGDSPLYGRLEYRWRLSSESTRDPDDQLVSLGLVIPFGQASRPMPAPEPMPVEEPDADGDGVPDMRDECPGTAAGVTVDARGCPLDSDGDGVADGEDQCPGTVAGAAVDPMGCELDSDGDGVVDRLDECPDTAEGVRVDIRGCEIRDVIELKGVNFETNSDRLLPDGNGVLSDAAATLRRYPDLVVEVAGYTDGAGNADYNQGLSERRATTVYNFLVNAGVSADKLSVRGYGEENPIADNATAEGRAINRRVELRLISQD